MGDLYAHNKESGDIRLKIYVPRSIVEEAAFSERFLKGKRAKMKARTYAFQQLFEQLMWAHENGKPIDIKEIMSRSLTLFSFVTEIDQQRSRAGNKHKKGKRRRGKSSRHLDES
jgi:hypothetical protein